MATPFEMITSPAGHNPLQVVVRDLHGRMDKIEKHQLEQDRKLDYLLQHLMGLGQQHNSLVGAVNGFINAVESVPVMHEGLEKWKAEHLPPPAAAPAETAVVPDPVSLSCTTKSADVESL